MFDQKPLLLFIDVNKAKTKTSINEDYDSKGDIFTLILLSFFYRRKAPPIFVMFIRQSSKFTNK